MSDILPRSSPLKLPDAFCHELPLWVAPRNLEYTAATEVVKRIMYILGHMYPERLGVMLLVRMAFAHFDNKVKKLGPEGC